MKKRINRRRFIELSAGTAVTAPAFGGTHAFTQTAVRTTITLAGKGSGHQLWKPTAMGSYDTITNVNSSLLLDDLNNVFSSMALDVYQKSKATGTKVDQWPSNGVLISNGALSQRNNK